MSLADTKLQKLMDRFAREVYLTGRTPDFGVIFNQVQEYLKEHSPGLPSLKMRPFGKKQSGILADLNSMLSEIAEDIGDANEERVDLVLRLMRLVADGTVRTQALTRQAKDLRDKYTNLLIRNPKATGVFHGIFDTFNDVHKTDTDSTTASLDLASGEVTLPLRSGVVRLHPDTAMAGLDVQIPGPGVVLVPKKKAVLRAAKRRAGNQLPIQLGQIIQNGALGPAFVSTSGGWSGALQTDPEDTDVVLTLDVPLSFDLGLLSQSARAFVQSTVGGDEFRVSRLEITPMGLPMDVRPLHSNDGVNWLTVKGYENYRYLDNTRLSYHFGELPIQYLRLEMKLLERRAGDNNLSQWLFGLREVAFFAAGYTSDATYQSRALTPPGVASGQTFSKVVLFADSHVPEGTKLRYSVANGSGTDWKEIGDSNKPGNEAPLVVDFGNSNISLRQNNEVHVTSTLTTHETFEARTFYDLVTTIPSTYVPGSVKLWRGHQGWAQRIFKVGKDGKRVLRVVGNLAKFSSSDEVQPLYREKTEILTLSAPVATPAPIVLTLAEALVNDSALGNTSATKIGPYPFGRIIEAQLNRATPTTGTANSAVTVATEGQFQTRTITLSSMSAATDLRSGDMVRIVQNKNSGHVLTKYFRVDSRVSTTSITLLDPEGLIETGTVTFVAGTENWTSLVTVAAANTKSVTLVGATNVAANDKFVIQFWRGLRNSEKPLAGSIVVRDASGKVYKGGIHSSAAVTFVGGSTLGGPGSSLKPTPPPNGLDYFYDPITKSISRTPGSTIPADSAVWVDYDVEIQEPPFRARYTTEMDYVGGTAPRVLDSAGTWAFANTDDRLLLIDPVQGEIDITAVADLTPYLPSAGGRVVVAVDSDVIRAANGTLNTASAIYKVINAVSDDTGTPVIFGPRWFRWRRGIPLERPATEVPYTYLKQNTYAGYTHACAVDDGDLVIPYNPLNNLEFIYLEAGDSQVAQKEAFQYEYLYEPDGSGSVTSVKFKAELHRDPEAPDALTPVLSEYTLRLSY